MTRTRLYWTCQVVGWVVGQGVFVGLAAATGGIQGDPSTLRIGAALVQSTLLSIVATHGIHVVATRRGWRALPLQALVPRLVGAAVVAAFAAQVVGTGLSLAADPVLRPGVEYRMPTIGETVNSALTLSVLYLPWTAVYALAAVSFRLSDAERDRLHLRAALAEGRMRALEYQLNPHALFNALNTVRALILDDPAEARRAVTLLSGLLRGTLAAGREATHTLADEMELVRTTLAIESLRFEERLRVRIEVEAPALGLSIPCLLVQTLVENAVKHGVARCRDGGEVSVEATVRAGRLAIRVENPVAAGPMPDGTGTGLANARERLHLLYGDQAHLGLMVDEGRALAVVSLPAVPASDA